MIIALYEYVRKRQLFTFTALTGWFLGVIHSKRSYMGNTSVCPSLFDLVSLLLTKLPLVFSCIRHRSSSQKLCFKRKCQENRISDSRTVFKRAYILLFVPVLLILIERMWLNFVHRPIFSFVIFGALKVTLSLEAWINWCPTLHIYCPVWVNIWAS
jgi:hypothetical protein